MASSKLHYSVNICFALLPIAMQGLGTKEMRGRKQREWFLRIMNASSVFSRFAEKGNSSSKRKTTEDFYAFKRIFATSLRKF
jgi:hypothetical protein